MHAWEQIQESIAYIEAHLDEDVSIESLAKMASLSPFYYQRLFSRLVKKPVAEYVRLRRLARATEMLLQKDHRILDIALAMGFSSHEHFTRSFKDTFGMTPEVYRQHPQTLNHMTKPQLLFHYTLIDEGVPLITEDIVLEINRRELGESLQFIGTSTNVPLEHLAELGTTSGIDPLGLLWQRFHEQKQPFFGLSEDAAEIGVTYPCADPGFFSYFAGGKTEQPAIPEGFASWELPAGMYIVCSVEAESFEALVMDVLYKAQQYLYHTWLPKHQLQVASFCAERYASHSPQTTTMEIWLKMEESIGTADDG